ncbi:hypothetical protein OH687_11725 [Burkholderia anthina]|nr:hypothetical protein OH687_11725 [Burkholderia anthina]
MACMGISGRPSAVSAVSRATVTASPIASSAKRAGKGEQERRIGFTDPGHRVARAAA